MNSRARFTPPIPITATTETGLAQASAAKLYELSAIGEGKHESDLFGSWRSAAVITADALRACAYNRGTPWQAARIVAGFCADLAVALKEHRNHEPSD